MVDPKKIRNLYDYVQKLSDQVYDRNHFIFLIDLLGRLKSKEIGGTFFDRLYDQYDRVNQNRIRDYNQFQRGLRNKDIRRNLSQINVIFGSDDANQEPPGPEQRNESDSGSSENTQARARNKNRNNQVDSQTDQGIRDNLRNSTNNQNQTSVPENDFDQNKDYEQFKELSSNVEHEFVNYQDKNADVDNKEIILGRIKKYVAEMDELLKRSLLDIEDDTLRNQIIDKLCDQYQEYLILENDFNPDLDLNSLNKIKKNFSQLFANLKKFLSKEKSETGETTKREVLRLEHVNKTINQVDNAKKIAQNIKSGVISRLKDISLENTDNNYSKIFSDLNKNLTLIDKGTSEIIKFFKEKYNQRREFRTLKRISEHSAKIQNILKTMSSEFIKLNDPHSESSNTIFQNLTLAHNVIDDIRSHFSKIAHNILGERALEDGMQSKVGSFKSDIKKLEDLASDLKKIRFSKKLTNPNKIKDKFEQVTDLVNKMNICLNSIGQTLADIGTMTDYSIKLIKLILNTENDLNNFDKDLQSKLEQLYDHYYEAINKAKKYHEDLVKKANEKKANQDIFNVTKDIKERLEAENNSGKERPPKRTWNITHELRNRFNKKQQD
ncbi:MAG: hypothetical protein ACLFPQ_02520 [Candidatus Woesearchaeota archaeon]